MNISSRIQKIAMLAGLSFILSACAGSVAPVKSPIEYRLGVQLAEKLAKEDVLKRSCTAASLFNPSRPYQNLNRHLETIKSKHTDSFARGFRSGYVENYRKYYDLYCGE